MGGGGAYFEALLILEDPTKDMPVTLLTSENISVSFSSVATPSSVNNN